MTWYSGGAGPYNGRTGKRQTASQLLEGACLSSTPRFFQIHPRNNGKIHKTFVVSVGTLAFAFSHPPHYQTRFRAWGGLFTLHLQSADLAVVSDALQNEVALVVLEPEVELLAVLAVGIFRGTNLVHHG